MPESHLNKDKINHGELALKVLTTKDWPLYRNLRLSSLQDSPDSFGSTYEREVNYSKQEWIARLDENQREKFSLPLVAELNGVAAGLAWGVRDNENARTADIYQMWVSPSARGYGLGKLLLKQLIDWAKQHNVEALFLAVTTTNMAAIKLYKSIGFEVDGELEALRSGASLQVQPMKLTLATIMNDSSTDIAD